MTNGLRITGLSAAFGTHRVLDDVSLSVAPGETLVLFGPSGAGKTTLLRAIAGVEPAAHGRIEIAGRDMTHTGPERRGIGVAFQNFALYPHMTAYRNIASPLEARRLPAAEIDARVKDIARLLKIDHVLGHMPRQLSNGQKQRTALARALVGRPGVLLLDDPLRNVDAKLRYEMRMELPRLLRGADREAATIYVSQDYREAMALADRIAVLIDGRIVQEGAPETIYDMPATIDVARLFGDPPVNLVPCRPRAEGGDLAVEAFGIAFRLGRDLAAAGRDCLLGLRPEDIAVHREAHPSGVPATVIAATPLQERLVLLLRRPDGVEVLANVAGAAPAANSPVWMAPRTDRALLYDAGSGARLAYSAAKRAEVAA